MSDVEAVDKAKEKLIKSIVCLHAKSGKRCRYCLAKIDALIEAAFDYGYSIAADDHRRD